MYAVVLPAALPPFRGARRRVLVVNRIVLALFVALLFRSPSFAADDDFQTRVAPVLKQHCTQCHGGDEPKGDFNLQTLTPDFAANATSWNGVLDRLADGSMPPKGRARPTAEESRIVHDWIAAGLA